MNLTTIALILLSPILLMLGIATLVAFTMFFVAIMVALVKFFLHAVALAVLLGLIGAGILLYDRLR